MEVHIRPLEEKDAYTSVKWRNIPEIWTHTEFQATREITIDDELEWVRKVTSDPNSHRFAILSDDAYVGNIYLTDIKDGVGEYHIFIGDRDYWGRGIAQHASRQLLEFARDKLKLSSVILRVRDENKAAVSIYEKLGFRQRGIENDFVVMSLDLNGYK